MYKKVLVLPTNYATFDLIHFRNAIAEFDIANAMMYEIEHNVILGLCKGTDIIAFLLNSKVKSN